MQLPAASLLAWIGTVRLGASPSLRARSQWSCLRADRVCPSGGNGVRNLTLIFISVSCESQVSFADHSCRRVLSRPRTLAAEASSARKGDACCMRREMGSKVRVGVWLSFAAHLESVHAPDGGQASHARTRVELSGQTLTLVKCGQLCQDYCVVSRCRRDWAILVVWAFCHGVASE